MSIHFPASVVIRDFSDHRRKYLNTLPSEGNSVPEADRLAVGVARQPPHLIRQFRPPQMDSR